MSDNIFEGDDDHSNTPQQDDQISVDQLVGDDKQYKTVDELAKAKLHADQFINQLKGELSGLREDFNKLRDDNDTRERLSSILDQLNTRNQSQDDDFEGDDEPNALTGNQSGQPDTKQIEALIESKITQIERERTANQNRQEAINKLKQFFGNDYKSRLEQRTEQLRLTKEEVNALAGRSPEAFLELIAPQSTHNTADRPVNVPRSSVNPPLNTSGGAQPGTVEFYKQMKKNDPSRYWTPKVQNQLHKDAIRAAQEGREFNL